MTERLALALSELVEALREELRTEAEAVPRAPDRLYSIDEAASALGLGRTFVYSEIAAGRLHTLKAGRRRLIPATSVAAYITGAGPDRDSGPAQPREGNANAQRSAV